MSLRLKAYQVMMAGQHCPQSQQLWEAVRPWSLEHSWQRLGGECRKSWLEHSCHLLSIRSFTTVLSPQTISYGLQRHENVGVLSCGQQTAFLISQFTFRSSSWRGKKSLQCKAGCELAVHQLCCGNTVCSCLMDVCNNAG